MYTYFIIFSVKNFPRISLKRQIFCKDRNSLRKNNANYSKSWPRGDDNVSKSIDRHSIESLMNNSFKRANGMLYNDDYANI